MNILNEKGASIQLVILVKKKNKKIKMHNYNPLRIFEHSCMKLSTTCLLSVLQEDIDLQNKSNTYIANGFCKCF